MVITIIIAPGKKVYMSSISKQSLWLRRVEKLTYTRLILFLFYTIIIVALMVVFNLHYVTHSKSFLRQEGAIISLIAIACAILITILSIEFYKVKVNKQIKTDTQPQPLEKVGRSHP